jgi:uncharacterized damage-inducible protein DinB
MMEDVEMMMEQLRCVHRGGAWHGPSVAESLAGLGRSEASARPIAGAHTIAEIVAHLTSTYRQITRRIRGDGRPLTPDEDWPVMALNTEESWTAARRALELAHDELLEQVAASEADPDLPVLEGYASLRATLHGLAHHDAYHAGQITLLRKCS